MNLIQKKKKHVVRKTYRELFQAYDFKNIEEEEEE